MVSIAHQVICFLENGETVVPKLLSCTHSSGKDLYTKGKCML
jgi:hypothetical protein